MERVDGHSTSVVQMLDFLDAPLYWKYIIASSWGGHEVGLVEDAHVPRYRWFLAPNSERVRLSTDLDGVGILYFLRGEKGTGNVLRMNLCELVIERRSGAAEFVDETPEPGRCGLAPEVPVGLSRRLDYLYSEFRTLADYDATLTGEERTSDLVGLRRSVDEVRSEMTRTWSQLSAILATEGVGILQNGSGTQVPRVEVPSLGNTDDVGDLELDDFVLSTQSMCLSSTRHRRDMPNSTVGASKVAKIFRAGTELMTDIGSSSATSVTSEITGESGTGKLVASSESVVISGSVVGSESVVGTEVRLGLGFIARV